MPVVYLLLNEKANKTYVGWTSNIESRISQHFSGQVKSTKEFGKFQYLVLESFENESEGRKKEKYWKSAAGRKKIKTIIMGLSSNG